ncbi:MAG: thioredoxin domain-containing protein [Candidatus Moranbacteria bacterium]|nr:thioredoxin domain-containing protein [Candidatus Moranbacteria bacterium]
MEEDIFKEIEAEEKAEQKKKMQNLISVIILLAGMFVGSLFIDTAQLIQKSGFSAKNLGKSDIFEASGKTWVAYSEPAVTVSVINDSACDKCNVDDVLVWLRRIVPTVSTEKVEYNSDAGKALIDKFGIKTLPAFVFDAAVTKTDFYTQAQTLFDQKDTQYSLRTQDIGIPVGKYLATPGINDGDAVAGAKDARVKVVVFSDFQCPYCKLFHKAMRDAMKNYGDKVAFDYKFLPLESHLQANGAALAANCALEQGKFWEYADKLYADQTVWGAAKDTNKFKEYARTLRLDAAKFNQCLDSKKYQAKIDSDKSEADSFGVSGTPGVFVNDQFQEGAVSYDQLKTAIDGELSK